MSDDNTLPVPNAGCDLVLPDDGDLPSGARPAAMFGQALSGEVTQEEDGTWTGRLDGVDGEIHGLVPGWPMTKGSPLRAAVCRGVFGYVPSVSGARYAGHAAFWHQGRVERHLAAREAFRRAEEARR